MRDFKHQQKRPFLKKLTINDSLKILNELYEFAYKVRPRISYVGLNLKKIKILHKVHSMLSKVN